MLKTEWNIFTNKCWETSIAFVGGISVDLIDGCGDEVVNIDSNFYYGFVDSSGVNQIAFEFGYIGTDYWTKPLYLKYWFN